MKSVKIDIKVGFRSDALLTILYRLEKEVYSARAWSCKTLYEESYFNDKFTMNLIPTEHSFEIQFERDDIIIDYENSYVEFGFTGKRDDWIGPGILKRVPLGELIPEDKK